MGYALRAAIRTRDIQHTRTAVIFRCSPRNSTMPAPPDNLQLREALQRFTTAGREPDTLELIQLFGEKNCTVLLPVRIPDPKQPGSPEFATAMDPDLGPVVNVYSTRADLPSQQGGVAVIPCTVLDLMGDLLLGSDVGVVFDASTDHAVYFRFNGPQWVVRIVARMRAEKRAQLN